MQGSKDDIEIDQPITYSLLNDTFNKTLKVYNRSDSIYVFKIKTNQRSVISMQLTHDFIKPNSTKQIIIKLAQKPSETTPLKLQINYVIPTEEQIRLNDSKMNSYTRDNVFRKIVTVIRNDSASPISPPTVSNTSEKNKPQEQRIRFVSQQQKIQPIKQSKSTVRQEKKQQKQVQPKISKNLYAQQRFNVRQAPYVPPQTKSEQITIQQVMSAQINISDMVLEAPLSSEQAIKAYQQPIEVSKPVKNQAKKPNSSIIFDEDFCYANSSPSPRKPFISQLKNKSTNQDQQTLKLLSSKIENQKITIHKLKCEYMQDIKSECVYPVPILCMLVLLAFLSGSLLNWVAS